MRMGARQACVLCVCERVRRVYYAHGSASGVFIKRMRARQARVYYAFWSSMRRA